MSAFRHPHNTKVRPIEEELAEMGLNPDRVLSEIDRNTEMLEDGPSPMNLSGLNEGDETPRSLAQYGSTLLDEKKKCKKKKESEGDGEGSDDNGPEGDEYEGMDEAGNGSCTGAYDKGGEGKKGRGRGMGVGKGKGPIGRRGDEDDEDDEEMDEAENWIKGAIKDPGRVREYLGVKEGETIPAAKLDAAIEKLKAVENKSDDQKSLLSALVLAKRLKGMGEGLSESDAVIEAEILDDALYLIGEGWELDEAFAIVKKARGAAARLAKRTRHRAYMMARGARKLASKMYRKRFKRKIKRREAKKIRRFGRAGLAKLHKMGRRIVGKKPAGKKEWADQLASIQEELNAEATAAVEEENDDEIVEEYAPAVEAMINAATTALYLGEIFDALGNEAGEVLYRLSDKAVDLADAIEANDGEPTEEQERHVETVLEAVIKALSEHESIGSPSLGEAIGVMMVEEGLGEWEDLVEGWNAPGVRTMKVPEGGEAMADPSVAGKYLKAINMAMQKMDAQKAMKAAEMVIKKHNVVDEKGLPVKRVENMTDVMRVIFYLSQITGLKAPAWMYRGKSKPWFVASGDVDEPGKVAATDAKLVAAMKALGAPSAVLKAMAAA